MANEEMEMELLEELRENEAKLTAELAPMKDRYERLTTELAMVQHGISTLTKHRRVSRATKWTVARLTEAESLHADGMSWQDVADAMGTKLDTLYTAIKRGRRKLEKEIGRDE